jgi:GT2 family glycosyltransferase
MRVFWLWQERGFAYVLKRALLRLRGPQQYDPDWIKAHDRLSGSDVDSIRLRIARLRRRPLFSVVIAVENVSAEGLRGAVDSLLAQFYDRWELRIVGDAATPGDLAHALRADAGRDSRITFVKAASAGIAEAGNAAFTAAAGEFIMRLDPNGRLAPHALYLVAEEINASPDANIIYTDEDKIDDQGRRFEPKFKTDWNPDLFLSHNYFGHLVAYRRELIGEIGGFSPPFEGAEDYDLALRAIERIASATIRHVPFVLYHHRSVEQSPFVDGPAVRSADPQARRALEEHLARSGIASTVEPSRSGANFRVRRTLPAAPPRVSLIIPSRDRADLLRGVVGSILERTDYPDYEIVVVDNRSTEADAIAYLAGLAQQPRVRVLQYEQPFNFSAINNFAASHCTSPILGLLNNDLLVIGAHWLTEMVSHAVRPEVGAVGAMLYYPDDTIQHAGIIAGFGGSAINCFAGLPRGSPGYCSRAELVQNYSAVTGACLLTRADVYAEVGGLNEGRLAVAFNDVDYCLRLRERGYLVTWTPYAEFYHLESASRGDDMASDKVGRFRGERAFLAERWATVLPHDPYYNPNLSRYEGLFQLGEDTRTRRPWRRP